MFLGCTSEKQQSQERELGPLELELQAVASCLVGTEKQTRVL